ncbi:MAG TPA: aldo/keto reductase [Oligoflexus sp.]|uniref:aldo/keto reductase n=1 Tax=Oligoflexus sp. TaxID=1971216 RepID=UPI002D6710EB|nr:aldo/keto reductase [Oligoflexus sp.]HYX34597.1 aldo/keto reductase [Oligoflexus sp.]
MEYRRLGQSGLQVPVFSFGTATFGGSNDFFKAWGSTDSQEAKRLVDICMDAGLNFFDTADVYSGGLAESILGQAIDGRRDKMLIATKSTFPMGSGPNDFGSSRQHIIKSCEASLKRLGTDYIDLYYMHGFDSFTPVEETLKALDDLVTSGKVRYIACSNFSGWHLLKSLSASDRRGWSRYVAHQVYYSLVGRELEWELIPAGLDQGVGTVVWSPLAGGALSGKIRRNKPAPKDSRLGQITFVSYEDELLYRVVDVLDEIAQERDKSIPQVALNWILRRPTVANIVVGARNEEQLKQNLGALGWALSADEVARLDAASATRVPYPYWHQRERPELVPTLPSITQ